ncbi:MAG: APC family permease [Firmicutes bacterium]|nr:APC family permease [Bacillota bacterium]
MEDNRSAITRALGRTDVISIGFGTIVGWSWIILGVSWVNNAGMLGAIIAFLVGGLVSLSVGFLISELTSALPLTGGGFIFSYRAFGSKFAFATGWFFMLAYFGVAAWEGIALASAIDYVFAIPKYVPLWEIAGYEVHLSWALVGSLGAFITMAHNLFGRRLSMLFQVMASAAVFVVVLILFFGGISFGSLENIGPMVTDVKGFFFVLMLVPAMLIGFDVIPQSAEEMNIEPKDIGHMIVVSVVLSIAWYCVLIIGVAIGAPVEIRESGILPVADVANHVFESKTFGVIVVLGGILGIMTTWNGFFMGVTRLIMSMANAGMLPRIFAVKSKRNETPFAATILVGIVCMAVPFLGRNALYWLVDTSSLCAMIAYLMISVTYIKLKNNEPDLQRPYTVSKGKALAIVTFVLILIYILLFVINSYISLGKYGGLIVVISWAIIGCVMYISTRTIRSQLGESAIEYRIFGKKYSRVKGTGGKEVI